MKVVIYEPNQLGHRLDFVRLLSGGLIDLGLTPTWVTTPAAAASEQATIHLAPLIADIEVDRSATELADVSAPNTRARFGDVRRLAMDPDTNWLYVPYADHIAQLAAVPGAWASTDTPVEGLMFRARFAYPTERLRDRALAAASLRAATASPWRNLFFLDPLATEFLAQRGQGGFDRLMPEPVEQVEPIPMSDARVALGLPGVGRLLVMAGAIDERKGAVELGRAFLAAELPDDVFLAFVGRVNPAIAHDLATIADADNRVIVRDRHLEADEFWAALCSADVLCVTYINHVGSSGVVAQAAYLGTPILASDYGWVGEATRRYQLGQAVDARNQPRLIDAIERLVASPILSTRSEVSEPYVTANTESHFVGRWLAGLREHLGS